MHVYVLRPHQPEAPPLSASACAEGVTARAVEEVGDVCCAGAEGVSWVCPAFKRSRRGGGGGVQGRDPGDPPDASVCRTVGTFVCQTSVLSNSRHLYICTIIAGSSVENMATRVFFVSPVFIGSAR